MSNSVIILLVLAGLLLAALIMAGSRIYRVQSLLHHARRARESGAPAESAQSFAAAAALIPWRTSYWEEAGMSALQGQATEDAINYFSKAASQDMLSPQGYLALGDAYRQNGDMPSATQSWDAAQRAGMPASEISARLLALHRAQGDYPAVLADLKALLEMQPDDAGLLYQLGLVWAATQPEEALPYLSQAAEMDESLAEKAGKLAQSIRIARMKDDPAFTLLEAGRALGTLNEWVLAAEAFRRAAQIRPDYAEAWAYLGEARQQLPGSQAGGDGLAELEHALQIDPESLSAHMLLSLYWQRQGQLDQALAYLESAAELYPDHPALQTEMGYILALQGDLSAAQQAYQQAIELAPRDPVYYRLLATFSLAHNYQVEQIGLPAARQGLLLSPNDPSSLDMLGQVLLELGDSASAKRFLERAILQQPQYAPVLLHLGLISILEGDRQAAFEKLNQVLTLAPGTATADQAQRLLDNYFP